MKNILVKLGGSVITDVAYRQVIVKQLVFLKEEGYNITIVHGGGKLISYYLDKLNINTEFYDGLRKTPAEVLDIVMMTLVGKVNKDLVRDFCSFGAMSLGLSGGDGKLIEAKKLVPNAQVEMGYIGEPFKVNTKLYNELLGLGYILVIATLGIGEDGYYNVNADHTAAFLAQSVKSDFLIYVSDVDGVMDFSTQTNFPILQVDQIAELQEKGFITEGMLPKLFSCKQSLEHGVGKVAIVNGKKNNSIIDAVIYQKIAGTELVL